MTFDITPYRRLYPFESRWLDVDGARLHYIDEGAGDPVVLVHGNPTWSFYYRELIKALSPNRRVIALDHVGCGLSEKPGSDRYPYTLLRRVEDLESLLDELGLQENVTFISHDWGGMISAACILRRPKRVRRAAFLNTAGFLLPPGQCFPWQLWVIRRLGPLAALMVRGFNAFSWGATHLATTKGLPRDVRKAYRAPYDNWKNRIATLRFVRDIPLKPSDESYALAKWVDDRLELLRDMPVFIGWGERDFVFTNRFRDEWLRRLPHAELRSYPDAGHYVLEDAAADLIPALCEFVLRVSDAAGDES